MPFTKEIAFVRYLLLFAVLAIMLVQSSSAFCQSKRPSDNRTENPAGEIYGNVIDSLENIPLGYITIRVFSSKSNELIGGAISEENGHFSITNIPLGSYNLDLSFTGYKTRVIKNVVLSDMNSTLHLKNVLLEPLFLEEVEVTGSGPMISYEIDKKVLHVEDQINTDGQTAIEILENLPSISISSDGTVSLRGSSSFTLLIDGVPTVLDAGDYLASLPASAVKEIEVITNPSAKYDAEGMSGVMNIITKKSNLEGVSLLLSGQTGTFNNHSSDLALSLKRKKFSFDLGGGWRIRNRPNNQIEDRITNYDSTENQLYSEGISNWSRSNWTVNGSCSWTPNNAHVLVLSARIKSNLMRGDNSLEYLNYDNGLLIEQFTAEPNKYIQFMNNSFSMSYQYNFKRNKDHNISFKAIANFSGANQQDTTFNYNIDGSIASGNLYTETGPSNANRFKIDYQLPINGNTFEAGIQSQFGLSGDIGKNYVYNTANHTFEFDSLFSSDVDYVRDIHAAYTMFGGKRENLGYQIGLRAEYTYRTISSTQSIEFTQINRLDWFPSAHFSYNLKRKGQIVVSYSRRIERPRSYYFEPFVTWSSPYLVRSGNPNLQPTYINAFEINYMKPLKRKSFYSLELYARQNNGVIQRLSSVYDEGILITRPENIGASSSFGLEGMIDHKLTDWWQINAGINTYYFSITGTLSNRDYDTESFNYSGRLTNTFNVKKEWIIQLISRYTSASVTAQGESYDNFVQDISIKRSILKKRVSITFQGRNVLNTSRRKSNSQIENVSVSSLSTPLYPQLSLALTVKLNNYQKVFDRQEEMDDF